MNCRRLLTTVQCERVAEGRRLLRRRWSAGAAGLGLIILARGLYQRLDGAWHLTVALLVLGIVTTLLKRLDYEVALLMLLVLWLLWSGRAAFNIHRNGLLHS